MKQGAPSKNVTPKKKKRRGQTDWAGTKAKRRKEARKRLLLARSTPITQPEVDSEDVGVTSRKHCSINKLSLGSIHEGVDKNQEGKELGDTLSLDRSDPMSDHQRRRGDRNCLSNVNVWSWLDNNYNEGHLEIGEDIQCAGHNEVMYWSYESKRVWSVI
jgi:hypothetical protein